MRCYRNHRRPGGAVLPSDMTVAQIEAIFGENAVWIYRLQLKEIKE